MALQTEISIESRARLIRQDWSFYDLSKYSDEELVKVWGEWFLDQSDDLALFIEELKEAYPGR